jgi:hypothetical protein
LGLILYFEIIEFAIDKIPTKIKELRSRNSGQEAINRHCLLSRSCKHRRRDATFISCKRFDAHRTFFRPHPPNEAHVRGANHAV